jgi:glucosamine kinase
MPIMLLADSGATKAAWCLLRPGQPPAQYRTDGLSPYFQTEAQLTDTLRSQLLPQLPPEVVEQPFNVAFYGTGCTGPEPNSRVEAAIRTVLPSAEAVAVASDMLGAARAVSGSVPGIVCILGTGANTCQYDGAQLTSPSYSLGFWLGDEGSGGNLGKRLVTTYLHGLLPNSLQTAFANRYVLDRLTVLDNAYNKPYPSRYFASFAPFLSENAADPFIQNLITDAFTDFVRLYIRRLPAHKTLPIHFIGSVAYYFRPLLEQVLVEQGLTLGEIMQAPMVGLVSYHKKG